MIRLTFFFSPLMFESTLGLWDIHLLGLDTPGSVKSGLTLLVWISGGTSHFLATLSVSMPPLLTAHPKARTESRLKIMCLGWCCNFFIGTVAWSQEMANSSYVFIVARSLSLVHACRFLSGNFLCTRLPSDSENHSLTRSTHPFQFSIPPFIF